MGEADTAALCREIEAMRAATEEKRLRITQLNQESQELRKGCEEIEAFKLKTQGVAVSAEAEASTKAADPATSPPIDATLHKFPTGEIHWTIPSTAFQNLHGKFPAAPRKTSNSQPVPAESAPEVVASDPVNAPASREVEASGVTNEVAKTEASP